MNPSHDRMELKGIEVTARHGVLQSEKKTAQPFIINVTLWGDFEQAQLNDDLETALDYSLLHDCIKQAVLDSSFDLIEALAGHLCRLVLREFSVDEVSITVTKVHPPIVGFTGCAAVTLRRGQNWFKSLSGIENL